VNERPPASARGRGTGINPPNRFEKFSLERDVDWDPAQDPAPKTQFYHDLSQTVISYNESPEPLRPVASHERIERRKNP
jgi:hypothetical protein